MSLLACSGAGAAATISRNIAFAQQQAAVVGAIMVVSLLLWAPFNRRIRYPAVCVFLLSFHPVWIMSATKGDCGYSMATAAMGDSLFALGALILQIRYAVAARNPRVKRTRADGRIRHEQPPLP
jgi:hypothetical protein